MASNSRTLLVVMLLGILVIIASAVINPRYRLMYNPSDSAPRGWYLRIPAHKLRTQDWVLARLPEGIAAFAAARSYLPLRVPILKQIGASAGQHVCMQDAEVFIDHHRVARAFERDDAGRSLPRWMGCRTLEPGEFFLLSRYSKASFDSRYFGPITRNTVIGRAIPLWTW